MCLCTIVHRNNEQKGLQTGAEIQEHPFSQFCLPGNHKPHLFLSAQILLVELLLVYTVHYQETGLVLQYVVC